LEQSYLTKLFREAKPIPPISKRVAPNSVQLPNGVEVSGSTPPVSVVGSGVGVTDGVAVGVGVAVATGALMTTSSQKNHR
jgi:hypothetical protein